MQLVNIQSSFREIIQELQQTSSSRTKKELFWVSRRPIADINQRAETVEIEALLSQQTNGKLTFTSVEKNITHTKFEQLSETAFAIQFDDDNNVQNSQTLISVPRNEFSVPGEIKSVTSLDVSVPQKLIALGTAKGDVLILSQSTGKIIKRIKCHDFDIQKCVYFPSGSVILTASLDMTIKLWDVRSGISPRTFISHIKRINDLATIGKTGRNFLSCSNDGYVKLWECGSGKNIKNFKRITRAQNNGVLKLAIFENKDLATQYAPEPENELEFGTKGIIALGGHESGIITEWDIFKGVQGRTIPSVDGYEVTSLALSASVKNIGEKLYVIAGYGNGKVRVWDLDNGADVAADKPVKELTINEGVTINFINKVNDKVIISSGNDTLIGIKFQDLLDSKSNGETILLQTFAAVGDHNQITVGCGTLDNKFFTINKDKSSVAEFDI